MVVTFDAGQSGLSNTQVPNSDITAAIENLAKGQDPRDLELVMGLQSYWNEADTNRKSGLNPREDKWRENLNLYWNRVDFSKKAQWQSRNTMPEVPAFVDRFASAMKEALISLPDGFYTVTDPADAENDLAGAVQDITDVILSTCGRTQQNGQIIPFAGFFEEQCKLGALMAMSNVVTWKNDVPGGRVAMETTDPRFVWLDHTGRNLYRIRRVEVDRYDLYEMLKKKDKKGAPLFKPENMEQLINSLTLYDMVYKTEAAGHGVTTHSARAPVTLDEYIATVLDSQGKVIADRSLCVVANQKFLIRGPEKNPFWHGNDWLVYTPLVPTPLSVYGRTYMEDFGSVATTFTELTNLLLDAAFAASLNAWAIAPGALLNPEQLGSGVTPNKVFLLEEGVNPKEFAEKLELGTLSDAGLKMWQLLKNELTEASGTNEIGLGQFAPKSRTTATEVQSTQQNSSAIVRSIANTVEMRWLDVNLDLMWKTALQHMSLKNKQLKAAAGDQMFNAIYANRRELVTRPFTFQARGISNTMYRAQQFKALMTIFQIIGSNPNLSQAFFQEVPLPNLLDKMLELSGIDFSKMKATDRDKAMQAITQPMQQAVGAQGTNQQPGPRTGQSGNGAIQGLAKMFNQPSGAQQQ